MQSRPEGKMRSGILLQLPAWALAECVEEGDAVGAENFCRLEESTHTPVCPLLQRPLNFPSSHHSGTF